MPKAEAKSKIKFLADECTFVQTVRLMRDLGCEVQRIQELGMSGASEHSTWIFKSHWGSPPGVRSPFRS